MTLSHPQYLKGQQQLKKGARPRPPVRLLREIATELGISSFKLAGLLRASKNPAPLPKIINGSKSWYCPVEVMAWWKINKPSVL
jgi:hypothetical protein